MSTVIPGAALAVVTTPVVAAVPIPISAHLMRLIEAHRAATAELERISGIADDMLFAQGSVLTDEEDAAIDAANEATERAGHAEAAAFTALMSHPPRDLDELRAMVRHGQDMIWHCCRVNDHDFKALIGAILAGGRPA